MDPLVTDSFCRDMPYKAKQDEVTLFASTEYKTYVHVGIQSHETTQVICLTDTRTSLAQGREAFLHQLWKSRIRR